MYCTQNILIKNHIILYVHHENKQTNQYKTYVQKNRRKELLIFTTR